MTRDAQETHRKFTSVQNAMILHVEVTGPDVSDVRSVGS